MAAPVFVRERNVDLALRGVKPTLLSSTAAALNSGNPALADLRRMPRFTRADESNPGVERKRAEDRMRVHHARQCETVGPGDRFPEGSGRSIERRPGGVRIEAGGVQH